MKEIKLPCYGIVLQIDESSGGGTIKSNLYEVHEFEGEWLREFVNGDNGNIDAFEALESIILAHACAGIDVSSPAYLEGIETSVDKLMNVS